MKFVLRCLGNHLRVIEEDEQEEKDSEAPFNWHSSARISSSLSLIYHSLIYLLYLYHHINQVQHELTLNSTSLSPSNPSSSSFSYRSHHRLLWTIASTRSLFAPITSQTYIFTTYSHSFAFHSLSLVVTTTIIIILHHQQQQLQQIITKSTRI